MILRLVVIATCCTVPMALLASDKGSSLSAFPDAGKSLEQLARESVDREIAASVQGKRPKEPMALLTLPNLPPRRLPQQARSESCSIPLLEPGALQHEDSQGPRDTRRQYGRAGSRSGLQRLALS
jgi:hypothetical protein